MTTNVLDLISKERIEKDIRYLCEDIGVRFVGTSGEMKATEFVAQSFKECGLNNVHFEEFTLESWHCEAAELKTTEPKGKAIECLPVSYTGSTPEDGVEAPLVRIENATELDLAKCETLGKIGLMWGSFGGSHAPKEGPEKFKKLLNSGLEGLIMVEDRVPASWPRAEGIAPDWFKYGTMPMVSICYNDALSLLKQEVERVHLRVKASRLRVTSRNVVGEIPGEKKAEEIIVITGHHDTVPNSVGATDNASAVANVLELARIMNSSKPQRTIRLISFGSEEQLSMGATRYVIRNKPDMHRIVLDVNMDGLGMPIGRRRVLVTGPKELETYAKIMSNKVGYSADVRSEVTPFSDHFPFAMYGVPTLYYEGKRPNFFFHSRYDTPDMISFDELTETAQAIAYLADDIANLKILPFDRQTPEDQLQDIRWNMKEMYGITEL